MDMGDNITITIFFKLSMRQELTGEEMESESAEDFPVKNRQREITQIVFYHSLIQSTHMVQCVLGVRLSPSSGISYKYNTVVCDEHHIN